MTLRCGILYLRHEGFPCLLALARYLALHLDGRWGGSTLYVALSLHAIRVQPSTVFFIRSVEHPHSGAPDWEAPSLDVIRRAPGTSLDFAIT
jgi:hypothetical protein